MAKYKAQCPIDQGDGVVITDVNFYAESKIIEYICSIEGRTNSFVLSNI
jgi:hypothetical protein